MQTSLGQNSLDRVVLVFSASHVTMTAGPVEAIGHSLSLPPKARADVAALRWFVTSAAFDANAVHSQMLQGFASVDLRVRWARLAFRRYSRSTGSWGELAAPLA